MARHDQQFWDDHFGGAESRAHIDALIGPGLRQAFPLPAAEHAHDDRFRLLLDALAQCSGGNRQASDSENTSDL